MGDDGGDFRPAGTISREGMHAFFLRQEVTLSALLAQLY